MGVPVFFVKPQTQFCQSIKQEHSPIADEPSKGYLEWLKRFVQMSRFLAGVNEWIPDVLLEFHQTI